MEIEKENPDINKKKASRNFIILVIYVAGLLFLYYLFVQFDANPLLALVIVVFVFFIFIGPIFKFTRRKSLYAKMFPDKKKVRQQKRLYMSEKKSPLPEEPKKVDLSFKYQRSLVLKCYKCGMIIPNIKSLKKCPACGEPIIS